MIKINITKLVRWTYQKKQTFVLDNGWKCMVINIKKANIGENWFNVNVLIDTGNYKINHSVGWVSSLDEVKMILNDRNKRIKKRLLNVP